MRGYRTFALGWLVGWFIVIPVLITDNLAFQLFHSILGLIPIVVLLWDDGK